MSEPLVKPKQVKCPTCGGPSLYKGIDLGAWANESFSLPEETPSDQENFGDPKLQ